MKKDNRIDGHFYANIKYYLQFDRLVPFREEGGSWESALTKSDGSVNKGAFGRAVRNIQESEVDAILGAGFRTDLPDFFPDAELSKHEPEGFFEDTEEF